MNAIYPIILEVRRLFHALSALADTVHYDLNITASQRAVLEALVNSPGQTVPAVARDKGVTRQHIQGLVNPLLEARLLEQEPNPAHKRSPILNPTPAGRECFEKIRTREEKLLRRMAPALRDYDLASVASCLQDISAYIRSVMPTQQSDDTSSPRRS